MYQVEKNDSKHICPNDDIAAYVDGELSAEAETAFERHISECEACARGLLDQRQFLAALTASFDDASSIQMPADFTKRVVSNAESTVAGVRRPNELLTAVCITAALFSFSLFAFGGEAFAIAITVEALGERVLALGLFVLRMAGGLAFAIAVISRSLVSSFEPAGLILLVTMLFAAVFVFYSSGRLTGRRGT